MTVTTVAINCDVSLADDSEFSASQLDFTLSGPDYDTVSNDAIPAATISVALDADGLGTANLWPVDRGARNTYYTVTVTGARTIGGKVVAQTLDLGRIAPPEDGAPHDLADLLAQSSGSIAVGSTIYATLADAVSAALAAQVLAEASAQSAGTAAIAAGAAIYPTTAAGIAAVADGALFYVPASGGGLTIYERDGASAVQVGTVALPEAATVTIADAGGYYTGGTVEAALQEVGSILTTVPVARGGTAATTADNALVNLAAQKKFAQVRKDVATLLADTTITYTAGTVNSVTTGDVVQTAAEGFAYSVAASGASDHDVTTAGGVKLYVRPGRKGYEVEAFGAKCDGTTDDTLAVRAAFAASSLIQFPAKTIRLTDTIDLTGSYGCGIIGSYSSIYSSGVTKFVMDASNRPIFKVRGPVKLVDFAFEYATQQTNSDTASVGIALYLCSQFEIRNIWGLKCAITLGIPQEALAGFPNYNTVFAGSIENVWSYQASITHVDLRGYLGGNTNCSIGPLYINGGLTLDLAPVPPTITSATGSPCAYGLRLTNWSGAEVSAVSIDAIEVTETGIELQNFYGSIDTIRAEGVWFRKAASGFFKLIGGENSCTANLVEFRSLWTTAGDALASTLLVQTNSPLAILDIQTLRFAKCSIAGGTPGRSLSTFGVTNLASEIHIRKIIKDGLTVNVQTDTWTDGGVTFFPHVVKVFDGSIVAETRRAGPGTAYSRVVYITGTPGTSFTYGAPANGDRAVQISFPDFGRTAEWVFSGTIWAPAGFMGGESSLAFNSTDADFTLTPQTSRPMVLMTATLTADRTVTLSTTSGWNGCTFRVTRTGGGAFNLSVGGLKNLATNQWCEVVYDGSNWRLAQFGSL